MDTLAAILRDPISRTILAVLAICVAASLFFVGQWLRRKALTYMVDETRVLSVHDEVKSRVQVLFDGVPAKDVSLVMITINNSGGEPSRASDFDRPLRFQWEEPTHILTAEVVSTRPEYLQPIVKAGTNELVLEPLLLNGGDWLNVKVLVNESGALSVDGRIVGVKQIRKVSTDSIGAQRRILKFVMVMCASLVVVLAGRGLGLWVPDGPAEKWAVFVFFLVTVLFLIEEFRRNAEELIRFYREKSSKRRSRVSRS